MSSRFTLLAAALLLSACASTQQSTTPAAEAGKSDAMWGWDDKADAKSTGKGDVSITVVLKQQKAYIKRGDTQIGWSYVASGIEKYPTDIGTFKVLERTVDKQSNLYGKIYDANGKVVNSDAKMGRDSIPDGGRFEGAKMAYWMRITFDGLGMHVGPIPRPGRRASHGCIRLPRASASKIYDTVRVGTPVYIVENEGDAPVAYVPKSKSKPAAQLAVAKPAAVKPATPVTVQTPAPASQPAAATPAPALKPVAPVVKPEVRAPVESALPSLPSASTAPEPVKAGT